MKWNKFFLALHVPALSRDEIKHGLLLDLLIGRPGIGGDTWDFDVPGACAVKQHDRSKRLPIILGDISETDARLLAGYASTIDYPGVVGPGLTAQWFACRASELGIEFIEAEPQQIYALEDRPEHPPVSGHAREVTTEDIKLFGDWLVKFTRESSPYAPTPTGADIKLLAGSGSYFFWSDNDHIVSMAGITRRLAQTAAITGVYTPPELRGRGYAAAITAVVAETIQASNLTPTLYTDLRVPASNRCYARIGFHGVATSLHFHRAKT